MKVISIINLKGGVGKTFTAANMAHVLNNQGKSVLLVDNDKQGNLSKLFGVYQDDVESGSAKLLRGWYKSINDLRVVLPGYAGLDIIPANMSLLQAMNDLTLLLRCVMPLRLKSFAKPKMLIWYLWMYRHFITIPDLPPENASAKADIIRRLLL